MCWPEEDEEGAKEEGGGLGPGSVLNVVGSLVCTTNLWSSSEEKILSFVAFLLLLIFFTYNYNVKYSGALEVVCPVTNPVSLYTFRCVRYVTCRNTFDVRFGRYSSGTGSVCALHVR